MKILAGIVLTLALCLFCARAGSVRRVLVECAMIEVCEGYVILVDEADRWPPYVANDAPEYLQSGDCVRIVEFWDGKIRIERN